MCRSRRELSKEYLLAKIGVDTAENEPLEVWGENSIQYSLHSLGPTASARRRRRRRSARCGRWPSPSRGPACSTSWTRSCTPSRRRCGRTGRLLTTCMKAEAELRTVFQQRFQITFLSTPTKFQKISQHCQSLEFCDLATTLLKILAACKFVRRSDVR